MFHTIFVEIHFSTIRAPRTTTNWWNTSSKKELTRASRTTKGSYQPTWPQTPALLNFVEARNPSKDLKIKCMAKSTNSLAIR